MENFYGPKTMLERVLWPIYTLITPRRAFDMDLYYGRIAFGYIAALILLISSLIQKDKKNIFLSAFYIISSLVWSNFMMGYIRYALCLEIFSGIVIIVLIYEFFKTGNFIRTITAFLICLTLIYQVYNSLYTVLATSTELSWRRTIFEDSANYKNNLKNIFSKCDYSKYLEGIDCFGIVDYNSGYGVLLSDTLPIIALKEGYINDYGENQFTNIINSYKDKRIFIISTADTLERTLNYLNTTPFKVTGEIRNFYADFLNCNSQIILLEVTYCENTLNNDLLICASEDESLTFPISSDSKSITFYCGNYPTLANSGNDGYQVYIDMLDENNSIIDSILVENIYESDFLKKVSVDLNYDNIKNVKIYFKNDKFQTNYNDWLTILNFEELGGI